MSALISESIASLIAEVERVLLSNVSIQSVQPHDPVRVKKIPHPWKLVGTGNYAAVFMHPNCPDLVVKIYAPGRPGFEEEVEVYRRLGSHEAFSECFWAKDGVLILKRLQGMTLYDCLHRGVRVPPQVIRDIDRALEDARYRGLRPHDVHGRNVMMHEGRGLVVDISDFLHEEPCYLWRDLKRVYYSFYLPVLSKLPIRYPYFILDTVRAVYRIYRRSRRFLRSHF
ncbi:MAG: serine/threonine protein kinase [Cyanobacteriota bacterium]|nr:serine/threonine protein kinase [Cyanobacteriota bacterium]